MTVIIWRNETFEVILGQLSLLMITQQDFKLMTYFLSMDLSTS